MVKLLYVIYPRSQCLVHSFLTAETMALLLAGVCYSSHVALIALEKRMYQNSVK